MPRGYSAREVKADSVRGRIDAPEAAIDYRIGQGMAPLIAEHGEDMVGVVWLSAIPFDEDEVRVRWVPPLDTAWDTGLWIAPERRMTRAFPALWAGIADWLRGRGLRASASRVADYNLASLAPHERMGARTLGTVSVARLGPLQVASAGRPRFTRGALTVVDVERLR